MDTVPLFDSLLEKLYRGKAEGSHKSGNRKIKKKPKLRMTCTLRVQWDSLFFLFFWATWTMTAILSEGMTSKKTYKIEMGYQG